MEEEYREDEIPDPYGAGAVREEKLVVADPLEPFNRAMHEFNDKLYFWALKPVAQGYKAVVPEPARIGVKNFFSNLGFPARFLSCLLQADFSGAATEAGRFAINTIWGIGGLLDPSSGREIDLQIQDTNLGETLGVYGVGQGFYLVWPVFGPSSPRDTVGLVGERLLDPPTYLSPWYAGTAVGVFEQVNATSLRIGDYESLKNAAIDPYVAFRDAYIQYRLKSVEARKSKRTKSASLEAQSPADGPANLLHAVAVAAHPSSAGRGVLVVMNEEIHSARDVAKVHAARLDAFASPHGPLGLVAEGAPRWYRALTRPHTTASDFDIAALDALPLVGVVTSHGNMRAEIHDAWVQLGARAIVHAGFGGGTVPDYLKARLAALRARGVLLVRASRTGAGALVRNANADDDAHGWVVTDDQNPPRARLLAALALTRTQDAQAIQRLFNSY